MRRSLRLLFLLLLLSNHISEAFSIDQTEESQPSTSDCPDKRTSFSIVWGCLSTALICAWVSVHPNIPSPKDYGLVLRWRRIQLMLWTLIAPELILAWAFRQRSAAKDIAGMYNHSNGTVTRWWRKTIGGWFNGPGLSWWRKGFGWLGGKKPLPNINDWTATHGYFLAMGGIILVPSGSEGRLSTPTNRQATPGTTDSAPVLTYQMFKEVMTTRVNDIRAYDIRILEAEIEARSKGDLLSKLIAVFQALWFILQCIARYRQKLAITELELLVGALASLNFFMYLCWMDKPLDVSSKARIGIGVDGALQTRLLSLNDEVPQGRATTPKPPPFPKPLEAVRRIHEEMKEKISRIFQSHPLFLLVAFWTLLPFYLFILVFFPIFAFFPLAIVFLLRVTAVEADQPGSRDLTRGIYAMNMVDFFCDLLSRVSSSIRDYVRRGLINLLLTDSYIILTFRWFILLPWIFVVLLIVLTFLLLFFTFTHMISSAFSSVFEILSSSDSDIFYAATHVPPFYSPKLEDDKLSRFVFASAGVCFGGLHLIAWTFTYLTNREKLLWLISSFVITIIPAVVALFDYILTKRETRDAGTIWYRALDFLIAVLLFVYILARLSLIGQALASLKHQPENAYCTVDWQRFIFHFS